VRSVKRYPWGVLSVQAPRHPGPHSGMIKGMRVLVNSSSPEDIQLAQKLGMAHNSSVTSSKAYLRKKWGCSLESFVTPTCFNHRPFNHEDNDIGFWKLDGRRRRCIQHGRSDCWYRGSIRAVEASQDDQFSSEYRI
jgi:hypothetical protein